MNKAPGHRYRVERHEKRSGPLRSEHFNIYDFLNREAGSAPTPRRGVGVVDLEGGADEFSAEVDFRAGHEFQAHFIDEDGCAVASDHEIIIIGGIG